MAKLILDNGTQIDGELFGCREQIVGEVVFYTGMAGYESVLTDPSFFGQIVVMTYPLIGNYGITYKDMPQRKSYASGIIVRELCEYPSNWAADTDLDSYLCQSGICGLKNVDTRALVHILREHPGAMGVITDNYKEIDNAQANLDTFFESATLNTYPVAAVSNKEAYTTGSGIPIAVLNLGLKPQLINALTDRGYSVTVCPHDTSSQELLSGKFKAVVISGGPGNPNNMPNLIATASNLLGKIPLMGIGLGHQLIALAAGAKVSRLSVGHRGENQPVKDVSSNRVYITSQNHGFYVQPENIKNAVVTHINWNDMSCEGLYYPHLQAYGVEFYPDSSNIVTETGYIYDRLKQMIAK